MTGPIASPSTPTAHAELAAPSPDTLEAQSVALGSVADELRAFRAHHRIDQALRYISLAMEHLGAALQQGTETKVPQVAPGRTRQGDREAQLVRWFAATPASGERLRDVMNLFLALPVGSVLSLTELTSKLGWAKEGSLDDRCELTRRCLERSKDVGVLLCERTRQGSCRGELFWYSLSEEGRELARRGVFREFGVEAPNV